MGDFFKSEEMESIEPGAKMQIFWNHLADFPSKWSKRVRKCCIFTTGDFFVSRKMESIEPGVKMANFRNLPTIFPGLCKVKVTRLPGDLDSQPFAPQKRFSYVDLNSFPFFVAVFYDLL